MERRSLLVLAASKYQLETIHTAQRLGYRVVCSDNAPTNPGHAVADQSYGVDIRDQEQILRLARREGVAGVISPCTDVGVATAAYVAEQLGLVGPPVQAAEIVTDKIAFRRFLKAYGFRVPEFVTLPALQPLPDGMFTGRRWIIKPDCSSGSKGVFIVASPAVLAARLPETLSFSPHGRAVGEEFIEGWQGTCEGVLQGGQAVLAFLLDRQTVEPPYVVTSGHRVPSCLPVETQRRIVGDLEKLWQTLGVRDAVFDCDFVASPAGEVYVLEMSPRLGGNCIGALLRRATGFHFVEYAIRLACGERPMVPQSLSLQPMAVLILGTSCSGRLRYHEGAIPTLTQTGWVEGLEMDASPGSPVQAFINGRNRIGQCFIRGKSYEDVVAKSADVLRRLQVTAA